MSMFLTFPLCQQICSRHPTHRYFNCGIKCLVSLRSPSWTKLLHRLKSFPLIHFTYPFLNFRQTNSPIWRWPGVLPGRGRDQNAPQLNIQCVRGPKTRKTPISIFLAWSCPPLSFCFTGIYFPQEIRPTGLFVSKLHVLNKSLSKKNFPLLPSPTSYLEFLLQHTVVKCLNLFRKGNLSPKGSIFNSSPF